MPDYIVTIHETTAYEVIVQADSQDAAEKLAMEHWRHSQDPMNDYCGNSLGAEVFHAEEDYDGSVSAVKAQREG